MITARSLSLCTAALLLAVAACDRTRSDQPAASARGDTAIIRVDSTVTHQTIVGWEAHTQTGYGEVANFAEYADELFDLAVYEVGINRVRLEVPSGTENPIDHFARMRAGEIDYTAYSCPRWETINDNADPDSIDPRGFHFTKIDEMVTQVVIPLKQRLATRGEQLYVNLTYTSFDPQCTGKPYIHEDPREYAELILATFLHMRERFGFVPDGVNIILEPENTATWTGAGIGNAITTTARVLAAHGFTPEFIGPSISRIGNAARFMDPMLAVPGVLDHLKELSYHRYGKNTDANLKAVYERAARHGLRTAMLERLGADHEALHADLEIANVAAWEQFALAYTGTGRGGNVLIGVEPNAAPPRAYLAPRTTFLRQYFKYIRRGARRIEARSNNDRYDALAFINVNGTRVVVIKAEAAGWFDIAGLPPGRYGISYTTQAESGVELPDVEVDSTSRLSTTIPAAGVITVFARSAQQAN